MNSKAKEYLEMVQDTGTSEGARKGWAIRKGKDGKTYEFNDRGGKIFYREKGTKVMPQVLRERFYDFFESEKPTAGDATPWEIRHLYGMDPKDFTFKKEFTFKK